MPTDTIREAIIQAVLADTDISAIVGTKAFYLAVPEGDNLPALIHEIKAVDRAHTLKGLSGAAMATARIGCASRDQSDCQAISIALKALFDPGTFPKALDGLLIWESTYLDEQDIYFDPTDDSGAGTFMIVVDYDFHYRET